MNAKDILMKAVQCDQDGRILEAQDLYEDGKQKVLQLVAHETDESKNKVLCARIKEYEERAKQIGKCVQNHVIGGRLIAQIAIDDDSCGNSYKSLFGKYLDAEVKEVLIEESYIFSKFQFQNFISFLELLVKSCENLKYVRLLTKTNNKGVEYQMDVLMQIKTDLAKHNVTLRTKLCSHLHDRKIVLSSGYIIKIGRGLDFFKPLNPLYSLGLRDYDFRKCLQTDVDIWRTENLVN